MLIGAAFIFSTSPGGATAIAADFEGSEFAATFKLRSSNGYALHLGAYSARADGRGTVAVTAQRRGERAVYRVPATVTATAISANFGKLGRIVLTRHPSGRVERLWSRCLHAAIEFEPATYEGAIRFRGEGGYVRVDQTVVRERSLVPLGECPSGGGRAESVGGGYPGARLKGTSYAHGRILRLQFNKNRPRGAKSAFSASVAERRGDLLVSREVHGATRSSAFTFAADLSVAQLRPPAPFSGRAVLRRDRNSVLAFLAGNLAIHFPGRTVRVTGRELAITLRHARFKVSDGPYAEI